MGRSREPRTGYRFGFNGRAESERIGQEATVDDILESLGRHTELADTLSIHEARRPINEGEDLLDLGDLSGESPLVGRGSLGRYAFSLMLVGGVVILLLYGFLSAMHSAASPPITAGKSLLGLILSDPVKLGLLGILFLVPVIALRKRRGRPERLSSY